jgi:hypothetical protein
LRITVGVVAALALAGAAAFLGAGITMDERVVAAVAASLLSASFTAALFAVLGTPGGGTSIERAMERERAAGRAEEVARAERDKYAAGRAANEADRERHRRELIDQAAKLAADAERARVELEADFEARRVEVATKAFELGVEMARSGALDDEVEAGAGHQYSASVLRLAPRRQAPVRQRELPEMRRPEVPASPGG